MQFCVHLCKNVSQTISCLSTSSDVYSPLLASFYKTCLTIDAGTSGRRHLRRDFGIEQDSIVTFVTSSLRPFASPSSDSIVGPFERETCDAYVALGEPGNLIESAVISPARSMYIWMLLTAFHYAFTIGINYMT